MGINVFVRCWRVDVPLLTTYVRAMLWKLTINYTGINGVHSVSWGVMVVNGTWSWVLMVV